MKKLLLIIILGMLFISLVSANLPHRQNKDFNFIVTSNNATQCNLTSVQYPDGTTKLFNVILDKTGQTFNYTIESSNFTQLGTTCINAICTDGVYNAEGNECRDVTSSGNKSDTADVILYSFLTLIFLFLCFVVIYLIIIIPSENPKDDEENFMGINMKKYIRLVLIAILYPLVIVLLNLMNAASNTLFSAPQFAGMLGFLFETMLRLAWVWTFIMILWLAYTGWKDTKIKQMIREAEGFIDGNY